MKRFLSALWRMIKSNWVLKIMSILFAIILWSYVIAENDPLRTREIEDVTVRYSNTEELSAKDLTISGSFSDILSTVNVKVEVKQNEIRYLSNQNVFAYVDLSVIDDTGDYDLDITATSSYGEVLSVTPSQISLHIDDLVTRMVPVRVVTSGDVADGYYAMDPVVSPEVVSITGARADVEQVVRSVCYVDLTGRSESFKESVEVELIDANGGTVDSKLFTSSIPSVIVDLEVVAMKSVPVSTDGLLLGEDEIASGYEVSEITVTPQTVDIIGNKSVLDGIDSIGLTPVSVSGTSEDIVRLLDYDLPSGVSLLSEGQAQVYISIKEITDVKTFDRVPVELMNLPKGMSASLDISSIDVSVIAGINKLDQLFKQDITAYVDLDGLSAGKHTLTIMYTMPEGFDEQSVSSTTKQVVVTLSK